MRNIVHNDVVYLTFVVLYNPIVYFYNSDGEGAKIIINVSILTMFYGDFFYKQNN